MPQRKIQANWVSGYFTPARVESADQTQGEEMALTKEDLLNEKLAALQTDVDSVGARTLDLATHIQNLQQKVAPVETELANVKAQLRLTTMKCEDLENRACRDNIQVRGLEEGAEGPDLEAYVVGLFSSLLGEDQAEVQVEGVHRVGSRVSGDGRRPRDVLAKLNSFRVKERILLRARQQDLVSFQGAQCSLFQDIAPATIAQRQQFRPVTEALRENNIKYRWTFPFGVAFELHNKACHFSTVEAAADALGLETRGERGATDFAAEWGQGGDAPPALADQWNQQRRGRKTPKK
ncbi:hypothetical protein NDU88_007426 [Pleurodeles waltl]|uniref:L1 transposable element RRM domain-containing protein n=1 Tax=Pleurodeles waltl TaxID=8319 RepID=A0AAV7P250_PLEWA|nr:hypothetical protein NDU88_007426 [Pleurodeles waltl]